MHGLGLVRIFAFLLAFPNMSRLDCQSEDITCVCERGTTWTASERRNMARLIDIKRQMQQSQHSPNQHRPQSFCHRLSCHSDVQHILTQSVLQQGLVLGLSHPVGVTPLGLVSAKTRVSCNLSVPIKLRMDTGCPESLTDTDGLRVSPCANNTTIRWSKGKEEMVWWWKAAM